MKKLAIFNFDGTLADSVGDIAYSGNLVLHEMKLDEHPEEVYRLSIGDGMTQLLFRILPEECRNERLDEARERFIRIYSENCDRSTEVYDGIYELLKGLKSSGIKTAVLSNKPHEFTLKITNKYFNNMFDFVLGQKNQMSKKPEPDGLFYILDQLGIDKSDCVYIGDSPVDVATARNAGVSAYAVSWGMRPVSELTEANPDAIAHTSEQLKQLILESKA